MSVEILRKLYPTWSFIVPSVALNIQNIKNGRRKIKEN